eukprot:TRINITY_DN2758_c0_g2_i1.p2 TRINITY_DN2758_c0_g2~~TRINITY_DN2758_c0_g2_i1.p2  ORF type:complete len:203 (+),score=43.61 TRINITY_DN2758_c0_g2_i1:431-1039(+)
MNYAPEWKSKLSKSTVKSKPPKRPAPKRYNRVVKGSDSESNNDKEFVLIDDEEDSTKNGIDQDIDDSEDELLPALKKNTSKRTATNEDFIDDGSDLSIDSLEDDHSPEVSLKNLPRRRLRQKNSFDAGPPDKKLKINEGNAVPSLTSQDFLNKIGHLQSMGFGKDQCKMALSLNNYDVSTALDWLLANKRKMSTECSARSRR